MAQIFAHHDYSRGIMYFSFVRIRAGRSERRLFVGIHQFNIRLLVIIERICPIRITSRTLREALLFSLQHFWWQKQLRRHRTSENEREEERVKRRRPARPVATVVEEGYRPPHERAALEYRPEQSHQFPRLRFVLSRFFAAVRRRRRCRCRCRCSGVRRPEEGLSPRCVLQDESALGRPQRGRTAPEDGAPGHD